MLGVHRFGPGSPSGIKRSIKGATVVVVVEVELVVVVEVVLVVVVVELVVVARGSYRISTSISDVG